MPFKEVNLTGGLNLQDSDLKKGFNEFEELDNLRHENGSLVKRYGTGTETTINLSHVDNMAIYVHRKLTGAIISDVSGNNITFSGIFTGVTCAAATGIFTMNSHNLTVGDTVQLSLFEIVGGSVTYDAIYGQHTVATKPDGNTFTLVGITASDISSDLDTGTVKTHIRMSLASTAGLTIPGQTADFRNIFKAGDTIVLSTSATDGGVACANKDKALIIKRVDSATVMTFIATAFSDEILDGGSVSAQITFVLGVSGASTPTNITIEDANSFDGRAFLMTRRLLAGQTFITLTNQADYTDLIDLVDYGAGTGDMHIRPKAYTDAVRFACGLEHDPRIFKYINRHHFNGLLKSVYNSNADLLYPRWIIDTAVPSVTSGTYSLSVFKADDTGGTADSVRYMNGSLDLKNNTYDYRFVPVYDGNQVALLENSIARASTGTVSTIHDKENPRGVLNATKSCLLSTIAIDMQLLNPRTSGINVYRSTNGGTYYKVKSIYMGDNDQNQHSLEELYNESDRLWWSGSTTIASDTLDAAEIMHDGHVLAITDGSGNNDFQSTNYKSVDCSATFAQAVATDGFSRAEYGAMTSGKFNHFSEETEIIVGGDDSYTGGSPNGGWYFANATEVAENDQTNRTDVTGYDGNMGVANAAYDNDNPFGSSASQSGFDFWQGNDGDHKRNAGMRFDMNDQTAHGSLSGEYIVSGWIKASGLNHPDATWNFYLDTVTTNTDTDGSGIQRIASGKGINNANMPWTYFQYQLPELSSNNVICYIFMSIPEGLAAASGAAGPNRGIRVWGLSMRQVIANHDLNQRLRGFMGDNILVSSGVSDLGFSPGTLKGNRIQEDSTRAYPVDVDADRSYISDNYGPFIKCVDSIPGVVTTDNHEDDFMFGSSNYQFYFDGSINTVQNMKLDFFDPGLPDGARHPNETATSTDVKFKYATILNGRQFVGNVKITGDEDTEEYPNFIMFSEPNSPDIIPTTNYIQLQDLQGGEIVGIESLMSSIVVFMDNGIFRLNVPNSNPTNWSLLESHPNLGCINDKAICKVPNGIFVATRDDIIFLDSGFSATPITQKIRTTYQTQTSANPNTLRLGFDAKYNRLRLLYSNTTNTVFYLYDIERGVWTQETHTGESYDEIFSKDTNENILVETDTNSTIRDLENTSYWRDKNATAIAISMKTGDEALAPFDTKARVRRVNTSVVAATTAADLTLSMDGSSAHTSSDLLNGQQSTRPYTLNAGSKTQIQISDDSIQNVKIEKVEVEYE